MLDLLHLDILCKKSYISPIISGDYFHLWIVYMALYFIRYHGIQIEEILLNRFIDCINLIEQLNWWQHFHLP